MTPERWERIKRVFDEAADLPPEQQESFLQNATEGDQELAGEVRRLLRSHESSSHLLDAPALDLHTLVPEQPDGPLLRPGALLAGRFEIVTFLNRGGMGEVYEALDHELGETVALKTIRPEIAADAEVIERFKREVRHSREVSHPNVCRVHELFCHDLSPGQRLWFLTMELLRGSTLLERLRSSGPLESPLALSLAEQLADGLSAAHAHGLVHRDFKSGNVMLVAEDSGATRAVITDFGLAFHPRGVAGLEERGGMGTPGYMAPEQEERGEVSPQADQFSLGVVLCEMATGERPVWVEAPAKKGSRSLRLPGHMPGSRWCEVIERCLAWQAKDRFPTVEDACRALTRKSLFARTWRVAALLLLTGGIVLGSILRAPRPVPPRVTGLVQLTPETDRSDSPSFSRDGKEIAYASDRAETGNMDIFAQDLPGGHPRRLTRDPADEDNPSLSSDGRLVAFRSERDGGNVYLTSTAGGEPERLFASRGRNPQFSPDGSLVAYWTGDPDHTSASGRIYVRPLREGEARQIAPTFSDARFPGWDPTGKHLLFAGCQPGAVAMPGCLEWWVASLDGQQIVNTGAMQAMRLSRIALWEPSGGSWVGNRLLFSGVHEGETSVWELKLDPATFHVVGPPVQLTNEEARDTSPTFAGDKQIAYTRLAGALHLWRYDGISRGRQPTPSKLTEEPQVDVTPSVSPNGQWVAFSRGRGKDRSLWVHDNRAATETVVASPGVETISPLVDDTGTSFVFEERENDVPSIFRRSPDRTLHRLCTGCAYPSGWFDADRGFFYREGTPSRLMLMELGSGNSRVVVSEPGAGLGEADWSPRTEYLLFTESKGGEKRIFATHLSRDGSSVAGAWIPVASSTTAHTPRWSSDGRILFYVSQQDGFSCVWAQRFSPEHGKAMGAPYAVVHFHHTRTSIDSVTPRSFNLSVAGDSLYMDLGEETKSVWAGRWVEAQ